MTFDKLYNVFVEQFAIKGLKMEQIGVLLNLIGALYLASKKKDANLDMYDFIYDKVVKVKVVTDTSFKWVKPKKGELDALILPICLNLRYYFEECSFKPSTMNLKSSKEILEMINVTIDSRVPF